MMLVAMLGVLSLVCPGSVHAGSRRRWAEVTLHNGVYRNVLIAVNRDVPETEGMIENIKVRVRPVNHVACIDDLRNFTKPVVLATFQRKRHHYFIVVGPYNDMFRSSCNPCIVFIMGAICNYNMMQFSEDI